MLSEKLTTLMVFPGTLGLLYLCVSGGRDVIRMVDKEYIRKKHMVEGWSIRKLSRSTGLARQTIRKLLESSDLPQYHLSVNRPSPVMDPYRELVSVWLEEDKKAPSKQRHTARRVFDRLVAEYGFTGGRSTVRRLVRALKGKTKEPFLLLETDWGQRAEVDWGQAHVRIAGEDTVAHLFCMRLKASQVSFSRAFRTEKLEGFLEGHVQAFEWFGGVPRECLYDNPKTAVVKILAGPEREEHLVFSSLRAHYLFNSVFCAPAKGNEKGSVENLVGYVRRNALVPVPDFDSWEELNRHLQAWSEGERKRAGEGWEKDRETLMPVPAIPFSACTKSMAVVSRYSLVTVDRCRYSVPCHLVGRTLLVGLFHDRVRVWDKEQEVADHRRAYEKGETVLEISHYLEAFAQKPRAVTDAAVVRRLPEPYQKARALLLGARPDGYRDFARILLLHREFSSHEVAAALASALEMGIPKPEVVRQIILNRAQTSVPVIPLSPRLAGYSLPSAKPELYDSLAKEVAS